MSETIAVLRFNSWMDAFSYAMHLKNWVFRGQADSNWQLETSLERGVGIVPGDTFNWDHAEKWMLRKFRGSAHHYLSHIPDEEDLLEWIALMQHHGAPTRLLDFTYSFPVAAYFAANNATSDCAIWGLNWSKLRLAAGSRFGMENEVINNACEFHIAMHKKANDFLRREASGALVFPVDPSRQNERIVAQQGLFLFPCDPARTFMGNLECLFPDIEYAALSDPGKVTEFRAGDCNVHRLKIMKLILPSAERHNLLEGLYRMNIHEASLFPGLDGFTRSLKRYVCRGDK